MLRGAFLTSASILMLYSISSSNPVYAAETIAAFSGGKWVAVMSNGRIVELADVDEILERPTQPYTSRLLSDTPSLEVALETAQSG